MNSLYWIEELLPTNVFFKNQYGGIGYYIEGKFVLLLTEESKTVLHNGISYSFQLFFGAFFPVVKIKHNAVIAKFHFLENHPVKKDWLYLPAENESFEEEVRLVLREIIKGNPLFGIPVKQAAAKKQAHKNVDEISDPRKPSLFNTDVPKAAKKKAKTKTSEPKTTAGKKKIKASKKSENALLLNLTKSRL